MSRARTYLAPAAVILVLAGRLGARRALGPGSRTRSTSRTSSFRLPSDIATSLWRDRSLLADDSWVTLREVLLGFLCALAAGLAFAVILHLSETLRRAFYPLLVASQTIPPVAIAPILVVWFGFGLGPKLLLIALVCFFPITVNTLDGLRSVDPQVITMMRTLGASRRQILSRVELPSALPFFFSGTKIAIAVAVIAALFAEWAGADSGLGHQVLISSSQLLTARMFAAIALLGAMAIVLFGLVAVIERRVVTMGHAEGDADVMTRARAPWRPGGRRHRAGPGRLRRRGRHRPAPPPTRSPSRSTSTGTSTRTTPASTARSTAASSGRRAWTSTRRYPPTPPPRSRRSPPAAPIWRSPTSRRCCWPATRDSTSRRLPRSSTNRSPP